MSTVAIIQARMGSTRLPGKVMRPLFGRTILGHVLARVMRCPLINATVVATTTHAADEAIVAEAGRCGAHAFRGSETDVLARYYHAARAHGAKVVVRITSDCPLMDPDLLGLMLDVFGNYQRKRQPVDYLSNTLKRTYPRGLDIEIFSFAALKEAMHDARDAAEREHVTPYLYRHPELFRLSSFEGTKDYSHLRWTLDTPEDWQFIEAIYQALGPAGEGFSTAQVLDLLRCRPELARLNAHIEQKKLGQ